MKKITIVIIAVMLVLSLTACQVEIRPNITVTTLPSVKPAATPDVTEAPTEAPTIAPTEAPTETVSPTSEPSPTPSSGGFAADTPDSAGSGDTMFDIYTSKALVDLDGDGTNEQIEFKAGAGNSTLYINGAANTIDVSGLAQLFAVTNVDKSDKYLELVFTDKYDSGLGDTEFPYSYVYWWGGSSLTSMGSLMDVKFAGTWRGAFDATKYFKGNSEVYCLAHTTELTDLWYMAQFKPDGSGRKFKEILYAVKPVGTPEPLKIKSGKACLLLAHGDSKFFGSSYNSMWDYASAPHSEGRVINPTPDIIIIAQGGETLKIVGVLGPNWIKLQTSDGYKGWIKAVDGKVQGYAKVMGLTAEDIFSGIVIAG